MKTREQIAAEAVHDIDRIARDHDHYEYGLPVHSREAMARMVEAVLDAIEEAPPCRHRLADARNESVESGYVCVDCGALFAAADHWKE